MSKSGNVGGLAEVFGVHDVLPQLSDTFCVGSGLHVEVGLELQPVGHEPLPNGVAAMPVFFQ